MKEVAWSRISRFAAPKCSPGFLLWQVSLKWRRKIETALAPLNLTHPQFVLLASIGWLTRQHNDVTQAELARHCGMDVNMTSQVLRTLEQKGWIERQRRQGDERSKFPRLTENGAKLIEQAIPLVEKVDDAFFGSAGSGVTQECIALLQKLADN